MFGIMHKLAAALHINADVNGDCLSGSFIFCFVPFVILSPLLWYLNYIRPFAFCFLLLIPIEKVSNSNLSTEYSFAMSQNEEVFFFYFNCFPNVFQVFNVCVYM